MRIRVNPVMILSAVCMLGICSPAWSQGSEKKQPPAGQGFPDLVSGLKKTPGCIGVEIARTASGKQVIFAWFEDKKAVMKWYRSEMHQKLMKDSFPDRSYSKPLKDIPENSGPIMAIASITFSKKPELKETELPISQIAIELYQPMSGGIFLGGRFAPEALKVPNMQDYSPKK